MHPDQTYNQPEEQIYDIKFPTTWDTSRGGTNEAIQPKVFILKKDQRNFEIQDALQIYFEYHPKYNKAYNDTKYIGYNLKGNDIKYTIKQIETYIKKNTPNPRVLWINRSQICLVAECHPEMVNVKEDQMDMFGQYWFSYADAVKEVMRLRRRIAQENQEQAAFNVRRNQRR